MGTVKIKAMIMNGNAIDESGNTYGFLTVLERASSNKNNRAQWLCRCDCGNEVVVTGHNLRRGAVKSCGCLVKKDVKGRKFGRLTPIKETERRFHGSIVWQCKCDCGNECFVPASSLDNTRSCGCSRIIDETGNTYGELVVVDQDHINSNGAYWLCKCSCGNETVILGSRLRNGTIESCGCLRFDGGRIRAKSNAIDISNERFGRLVAIEPTDQRSGGSIVWKCRCDCGNEAFASVSNLRFGVTRSCGCYQHERAVESGRSRARDISGEKFTRLTPIRPTNKRNRGYVVWLCECDCGNKTLVDMDVLVSGSTKSCGCLREEMGKQLGEKTKHRWKNGDFDGVFQSPTSIEVATAKALSKADLDYEQEYRPDGYSRPYDFFVEDSVLIEVQGDYWHANPNIYSKEDYNDIQAKSVERDDQKAEWAKEHGYELIELWEQDINERGSLALIREKVLPLLRG